MKSKIIEICHSDLKWSDSISSLENRNHVDLFVKVSHNICPNIKEYELFRPVINHEKFKPAGQLLKNTIGTIARFSNEKNLFYILEIAKIMPEYNFIIVGEGSLKPIFIKKALEMNIFNVFVEPFVLDIEKVYRKFGAFMLTSHVEGFPITAIEAMACNIPIISPKIGGMKKLIDEGLIHELCRIPIQDSKTIKKIIGNKSKNREYTLENHSYKEYEKFIKMLADKSISYRRKYDFETNLDFYYG